MPPRAPPTSARAEPRASLVVERASGPTAPRKADPLHAAAAAADGAAVVAEEEHRRRRRRVRRRRRGAHSPPPPAACRRIAARKRRRRLPDGGNPRHASPRAAANRTYTPRDGARAQPAVAAPPPCGATSSSFIHLRGRHPRRRARSTRSNVDARPPDERGGVVGGVLAPTSRRRARRAAEAAARGRVGESARLIARATRRIVGERGGGGPSRSPNGAARRASRRWEVLSCSPSSDLRVGAGARKIGTTSSSSSRRHRLGAREPPPRSVREGVDAASTRIRLTRRRPRPGRSGLRHAAQRRRPPRGCSPGRWGVRLAARRSAGQRARRQRAQHRPALAQKSLEPEVVGGRRPSPTKPMRGTAGAAAAEAPPPSWTPLPGSTPT